MMYGFSGVPSPSPENCACAGVAAKIAAIKAITQISVFAENGFVIFFVISVNLLI
jgi:hypothetical protein